MKDATRLKKKNKLNFVFFFLFPFHHSNAQLKIEHISSLLARIMKVTQKRIVVVCNGQLNAFWEQKKLNKETDKLSN